MKRSNRRISPALAVSGVALFASLGGVSYGVATNSIDSREIRNNSVSSKDLRNGTIVAKDIKAATRNALKGAGGTKGDKGEKGEKGDAGTPGAPGTAGAPGAPATRLFAVVADPAGGANATLSRGSGALAVTEAVGTQVQFDRNVSACAWIAGRNNPGTTIEDAGFAQVALGASPDTLDVRARSDTGSLEDGNFHVAVFC